MRQVVSLIREMVTMTTQERLDIMEEINEAYCDCCGGEAYVNGIQCQCWNDE